MKGAEGGKRVQIMPWRTDHAAALARTLGPADELIGQVRSLYGDDDGPLLRRTLVAELAGEPVGVATVFASRLHPARLWVSVEVGPAHRRGGVGTALLAAARRACLQDGRPLRGKVLVGSPGEQFARASGFRTLQRSRIVRLPAAGTTFATAAFVVDLSAASDRVATAFRDFYVRSHAWDPPGETTVADFRSSHVDEAAASVLVLGPQGSPLAVGCLYEEEGTLLFSGGPTMPGDEQAPGATAALLDAALSQAGHRGYELLLIEVDDSPPEVAAELERRRAATLEEIHVVTDERAPLSGPQVLPAGCKEGPVNLPSWTILRPR